MNPKWKARLDDLDFSNCECLSAADMPQAHVDQEAARGFAPGNMLSCAPWSRAPRPPLRPLHVAAELFLGGCCFTLRHDVTMFCLEVQQPCILENFLFCEYSA